MPLSRNIIAGAILSRKVASKNIPDTGIEFDFFPGSDGEQPSDPLHDRDGNDRSELRNSSNRLPRAFFGKSKEAEYAEGAPQNELEQLPSRAPNTSHDLRDSGRIQLPMRRKCDREVAWHGGAVKTTPRCDAQQMPLPAIKKRVIQWHKEEEGSYVDANPEGRNRTIQRRQEDKGEGGGSGARNMDGMDSSSEGDSSVSPSKASNNSRSTGWSTGEEIANDDVELRRFSGSREAVRGKSKGNGKAKTDQTTISIRTKGNVALRSVNGKGACLEIVNRETLAATRSRKGRHIKGSTNALDNDKVHLNKGKSAGNLKGEGTNTDEGSHATQRAEGKNVGNGIAKSVRADRTHSSKGEKETHAPVSENETVRMKGPQQKKGKARQQKKNAIEGVAVEDDGKGWQRDGKGRGWWSNGKGFHYVPTENFHVEERTLSQRSKGKRANATLHPPLTFSNTTSGSRANDCSDINSCIDSAGEATNGYIRGSAKADDDSGCFLSSSCGNRTTTGCGHMYTIGRVEGAEYDVSSDDSITTERRKGGRSNGTRRREEESMVPSSTGKELSARGSTHDQTKMGGWRKNCALDRGFPEGIQQRRMSIVPYSSPEQRFTEQNSRSTASSNCKGTLEQAETKGDDSSEGLGARESVGAEELRKGTAVRGSVGGVGVRVEKSSTGTSVQECKQEESSSSEKSSKETRPRVSEFGLRGKSNKGARLFGSERAGSFRAGKPSIGASAQRSAHSRSFDSEHLNKGTRTKGCASEESVSAEKIRNVTHMRESEREGSLSTEKSEKGTNAQKSLSGRNYSTTRNSSNGSSALQVASERSLVSRAPVQKRTSHHPSFANGTDPLGSPFQRSNGIVGGMSLVEYFSAGDYSTEVVQRRTEHSAIGDGASTLADESVQSEMYNQSEVTFAYKSPPPVPSNDQSPIGSLSSRERGIGGGLDGAVQARLNTPQVHESGNTFDAGSSDDDGPKWTTLTTSSDAASEEDENPSSVQRMTTFGDGPRGTALRPMRSDARHDECASRGWRPVNDEKRGQRRQEQAADCAVRRRRVLSFGDERISLGEIDGRWKRSNFRVDERIPRRETEGQRHWQRDSFATDDDQDDIEIAVAQYWRRSSWKMPRKQIDEGRESKPVASLRFDPKGAKRQKKRAYSEQRQKLLSIPAYARQWHSWSVVGEVGALASIKLDRARRPPTIVGFSDAMLKERLAQHNVTVGMEILAVDDTSVEKKWGYSAKVRMLLDNGTKITVRPAPPVGDLQLTVRRFEELLFVPGSRPPKLAEIPHWGRMHLKRGCELRMVNEMAVDRCTIDEVCRKLAPLFGNSADIIRVTFEGSDNLRVEDESSSNSQWEVSSRTTGDASVWSGWSYSTSSSSGVDYNLSKKRKSALWRARKLKLAQVHGRTQPRENESIDETGEVHIIHPLSLHDVKFDPSRKPPTVLAFRTESIRNQWARRGVVTGLEVTHINGVSVLSLFGNDPLLFAIGEEIATPNRPPEPQLRVRPGPRMGDCVVIYTNRVVGLSWIPQSVPPEVAEIDERAQTFWREFGVAIGSALISVNEMDVRHLTPEDVERHCAPAFRARPLRLRFARMVRSTSRSTSQSTNTQTWTRQRDFREQNYPEKPSLHLTDSNTPQSPKLGTESGSQTSSTIRDFNMALTHEMHRLSASTRERQRWVQPEPVPPFEDAPLWNAMRNPPRRRPVRWDSGVEAQLAAQTAQLHASLRPPRTRHNRTHRDDASAAAACLSPQMDKSAEIKAELADLKTTVCAVLDELRGMDATRQQGRQREGAPMKHTTYRWSSPQEKDVFPGSGTRKMAETDSPWQMEETCSPRQETHLGNARCQMEGTCNPIREVGAQSDRRQMRDIRSPQHEMAPDSGRWPIEKTLPDSGRHKMVGTDSSWQMEETCSERQETLLGSTRRQMGETVAQSGGHWMGEIWTPQHEMPPDSGRWPMEKTLPDSGRHKMVRADSSWQTEETCSERQETLLGSARRQMGETVAQSGGHWMGEIWTPQHEMPPCSGRWSMEKTLPDSGRQKMVRADSSWQTEETRSERQETLFGSEMGETSNPLGEVVAQSGGHRMGEIWSPQQESLPVSCRWPLEEMLPDSGTTKMSKEVLPSNDTCNDQVESSIDETRPLFRVASGSSRQFEEQLLTTRDPPRFEDSPSSNSSSEMLPQFDSIVLPRSATFSGSPLGYGSWCHVEEIRSNSTDLPSELEDLPPKRGIQRSQNSTFFDW